MADAPTGPTVSRNAATGTNKCSFAIASQSNHMVAPWGPLGPLDSQDLAPQHNFSKGPCARKGPAASFRGSPGKSGESPGKSGEVRGKSREVRGSPGKSGEVRGSPGKSGESPGKSGEVRGGPGKSGESPGKVQGIR